MLHHDTCWVILLAGHIAATTALTLGQVIVVLAEQAELRARKSVAIRIWPIYSDQVGVSF